MRSDRLNWKPPTLDYEVPRRYVPVKVRTASTAQPFDPVTVGLRLLAGTAAAASGCCAMVAVPCGVSAVVGYCYNDASVWIAWEIALDCGLATVAIGVVALLLHRAAARSVRRAHPGDWN